MKAGSQRWHSWLAPMLRWRDRLLSDPVFQRRSLRWPITRLVARRRMRALFDLCSGFVYSQTLLACTRLGLFERLAERPCTVPELAASLNVPDEPLARLLDGAEALRLVQRRGRGFFGLGPLGAALLGNPSVAMMIEHHGGFYADLLDPVALLRGETGTTRLAKFWPYSGSPDPASVAREEASRYSELMAASQQLIADQVLAAYPVRRHRRLLDIGGGSGAFVTAALRRAPRLQARVFDLPAVVELARARFEQEGLQARAGVSGGDFLQDPLPAGSDLISLIRIAHDHDDAAVVQLLRAIRGVLEPGGTVLIAEPMMGGRQAEPVAPYFGMYLLAMGQGRPRSVETMARLLRRAGFEDVKSRRTSAPLLARVITARPSIN
jgi:demethylspheroidene O-methyltransferase